MTENTPQLLEMITALTEAQDYQAVRELLITHIDTLQTQIDRLTLLALLEAIPFELPLQPLYLKGQLLVKVGRYKEASYVLNRAKILAQQQQAFTQAVHCCIDLSALYQRQEDFKTAFYYVQDAERILPQIVDAEAKARLLLCLAELCPDIGQLDKSSQHAREAFYIFSLAGDCEGQFKALYLLAIVNRQLGRYDEASSRLEMARQCQRAGNLTATYHARILSAEAHLLWYQGRLRDAISKAQVFRRVAELNDLYKQQIYACILLGNLYRAAGQYKTAENWYEETEHLVTQYDLPLYWPWIEIQRGWLKILTADLRQARRHFHVALQTDNKGMQMSFNVNLACLELLDGHYQAAENLFQPSRQYYAQSGDDLSYHVIGLYLAYLYCQQGQRADVLAYLQPALEWFTNHNILYFPNWWHPAIIAEIFALALTEKICTPLVERIFLLHLPQYEYLLTLAQDPATAVRQRAIDLHRLTQNGRDILAEVTDENIKNVLKDLLQNGPLRPDSLPQLQQKLSTAKSRHKFNATCVAVFGLYLRGCGRQEIAAKLDCSSATVRNYITIVYQAFHLSAQSVKGTIARKEALYQRAKEEGFVR